LFFQDFGLETLGELVEKTTFPWLMSNVIDNETGRPLADGKITHIMEWWGRKIGLVSYEFVLVIYSCKVELFTDLCPFAHVQNCVAMQDY